MFGSKQKSRRKLAAQGRKALGAPDWLESVDVDDGGRAILVLLADPADTHAAEARRIEAEGRAELVAGVKSVTSILTAEKSAAQAPQVRLEPSPRRVSKGARLSDEAMQQAAPPAAAGIPKIKGIDRILVVASAKGGVGKSTVAVNLAAAMAKTGMKVGLLDADVYGPSVPTMLGMQDAHPETAASKKLVPVAAHGLKTLSIGYLSDPDSLAIAQRVPVTAAIIVTTPQEVALADVRRGAAMFTKTAVPVLGIVETMSWFEDPAGNRHYLMGEGGGADMAQTLGLPLLAQIPMLQAIREGGDSGEPSALAGGEPGRIFHELARTVAVGLDTLESRPAPEIVFED